MKKKILIGVAVLVVLLAGVVGYFWYMMQQPLYTPGMLRASKTIAASLKPAGPQPADSFWVVEPGISLHHFADGKGTPVLVIHGGPGYPFVEPIPALKELGNSHTFVYYDQRGCGLSSRPIDRFSSGNLYENIMTLNAKLGLLQQLADIERIRNILGEEKLIIIGHSFGGFLAALYAAEYPEHVKAMILLAPATLLTMPPKDEDNFFTQVKPLLPKEMLPGYEQYVKDMFDVNLLFKKSDKELAGFSDQLGAYYAAAAKAKGFAFPASAGKAAGWMVTGMYFSMGRRHEYGGALKNVTAPVLVVHGAIDLQTERGSKSYCDALPNAQFRVIPGAGHFMYLDQPAAFTGVVKEFLATVR